MHFLELEYKNKDKWLNESNRDNKKPTTQRGRKQ